MPQLTYRYAGPADVAPVVALVESAYRGEASRAGWTSEADLIDGQRTDAGLVSALLADPVAHVLLAEEAAVLQACCQLREPWRPVAPPTSACSPSGQRNRAAGTGGWSWPRPSGGPATSSGRRRWR